MTHIMSHRFHTCDSLECMIWFINYDWIMIVYYVVTHTSYLEDFMLWLTLSYRSYVIWGEKLPGSGLREDAYIRQVFGSER